jgi:hypothetical protein
MTTSVCFVYHENNSIAKSGDGQPMLYVLTTDDPQLGSGQTGSAAELANMGYKDLQISARSRMYYRDIFGNGGK